MTNSGATYNEDINNEKTIDYYTTQFQTMIQDIKGHKTMMKNNSINISDKSLENNFTNLQKKMNNFYNIIENDTTGQMDTYEKNYLILYNIYENDKKKYNSNSSRTPEEEKKMLNKRKAYYTSQELYKRNTNIYYFQGLYLIIYLIFVIECLRSSLIGFFGKIIIIIIFGLLPYLVYHVIIPRYYKMQMNSDKYNIMKNVHFDE